MASSSVLIKLLVVVGCAAAASAATLTVGGASGWTTNQDYVTWANGNTFAVGDKLVFNFASGAHTVTEVSKSGYDSCAAGSNQISETSTGPATIDLTAGQHYYICTIGTHCTNGMKLAINVGSGSGSGSGTPPSTTPGSGTPPATPSSPSKPTGGASAGLQASAVVAAAAGVLVKLALF
uniref:Phytocyanin domain-containing protein n=1 Tax=Oryza punctata TaxID=4537 RepID=A0A0E0LW27_ORYPU